MIGLETAEGAMKVATQKGIRGIITRSNSLHPHQGQNLLQFLAAKDGLHLIAAVQALANGKGFGT